MERFDCQFYIGFSKNQYSYHNEKVWLSGIDIMGELYSSAIPDNNVGWANVGPTSGRQYRHWGNVGPNYIAVWDEFWLSKW